MKRILFTFAAMVTLAGSVAAAEIEPGLKLGLNSSTIDVEEDEEFLTRRTGPVAGASLYFRGERFGVQAEALYTSKGFKVDDGDASADLEIRWLEVPVLVRAELAPGGTVQPYLVAGPTIAFKLDTNLELKENGVSISIDEDEAVENDENVSSTDVGVAVGFGARARLGALDLEIEGRYTHGLSNLNKEDDESVKSRTATFSIGVRF